MHSSVARALLRPPHACIRRLYPCAAEALLPSHKVIGYGFALHDDSYLRDTWCQLDFVVVTLAWVQLVSSFVRLLLPTQRPSGPMLRARGLCKTDGLVPWRCSMAS